MKKVVLGLIISILIIAVATLSVLVVLKKVKNNNVEEKTWEDPDYEKIAEVFPDAMKMPYSMGEYILDKYLDYKALYALDKLYELDNVESMSDEDLNKKYKEILDNIDEKEKAYKHQKRKYTEGYKSYAGNLNLGDPETGTCLNLELKNIGDLEPLKITGFSKVTVTYNDTKYGNLDFTFLYYKDKLVMFYTLENIWGKDYGGYAESDFMLRGKDYYIEDASKKFDPDPEAITYAQNMNNGQKWAYNSLFRLYLGEGIPGDDIKDLLDLIIETNEEFVGKKELFVRVNAHIEGLSEEDEESLTEICNKALDKNNAKNVEKASEKIKELKKLIDSDKKYVVTSLTGAGVFTQMNIREYHSLYAE